MSEPYWVAIGGKMPIDYIGGWQSGTAYKPGDVVSHNGVDYIAVNPSIDVTPPSVLPIPVGIGTSLPSSPVDGQEYILVNSLTAPTYSWRFRYVSGIADAYKWVCIGGAPFRAGPMGSVTVSDTNRVDVTGGPVITIPRSGIYRTSFGAHHYNQGTFGGVFASHGVLYNAGVAIGSQLNKMYHSYIWDGGMYSTMAGDLILAAASTLNMRAFCDRTGSSCVVTNAWIETFPVRVS